MNSNVVLDLNKNSSVLLRSKNVGSDLRGSGCKYK